MVLHRWLVLAVAASFVVAAVACGQQGGSPGDDGSGDAAPAPDAPRGSDGAHDTGAAGDAGGHDADAGGSTGDGASGDAAGHEAAAGDAASGDAGGGDSAVGDSSAGDAKPSDGPAGEAAASDSGAGDAANDGASDGASDGAGSGGDGGSGGDAGGGVITGGPCVSGAAGAAAYRVRWIDAGGTAQVQYEVDGLPDKSRDKTGAYGYQIGFTPSYVDPFLAQGGLQLDGSDFVDVEISTVGVSSITRATLSLYGRSYSVDTSGGFAWQTFDGTGQTPADFVSNVPPYQWYSADVTGDILPGESGVLLRITAGGMSGALVVNRIELCFVAQ